ncbi:hypothetical protein K437DRAFT_18963 [Tilletiaria anomala UBC 951]|uniref:Uncharacterized protein n=1 Tax=Tilletiaria anomala (strain ATCC 24038 / CBS 436.72 / UBC 951) TaxID=1037660 RepID=A0A066VB24_TILAU|nr:uncharacterized protein K437DRAFT_18963 [Tilletiaria anomala UBC 951]KDN38932.1 hypothetical protein K437DRAFT_18963 [Tilletiaria anomala UBC 951]
MAPQQARRRLRSRSNGGSERIPTSMTATPLLSGFAPPIERTSTCMPPVAAAATIGGEDSDVSSRAVTAYDASPHIHGAYARTAASGGGGSSASGTPRGGHTQPSTPVTMLPSSSFSSSASAHLKQAGSDSRRQAHRNKSRSAGPHPSPSHSSSSPSPPPSSGPGSSLHVACHERRADSPTPTVIAAMRHAGRRLRTHSAPAGAPSAAVATPLSFFPLAPAQPLSIDTCQPLLLPSVSLVAQTLTTAPIGAQIDADQQTTDAEECEEQEQTEVKEHEKAPRGGADGAASAEIEHCGTATKSNLRAMPSSLCQLFLPPGASPLDAHGLPLRRFLAATAAGEVEHEGAGGGDDQGALRADAGEGRARRAGSAGKRRRTSPFAFASASVLGSQQRTKRSASLLESDGSCHGDPGDEDPETQLALAILRMRGSSSTASATAAASVAAAVAHQRASTAPSGGGQEVIHADADATARNAGDGAGTDTDTGSMSASPGGRRTPLAAGAHSRPRPQPLASVIARAETYEQEEARLARAIQSSTLPFFSNFGKVLFFFDSALSATDPARVQSTTSDALRRPSAPTTATAESPIRRRMGMLRGTPSASTPEGLLLEAQQLRCRSLARHQHHRRSTVSAGSTAHADAPTRARSSSYAFSRIFGMTSLPGAWKQDAADEDDRTAHSGMIQWTEAPSVPVSRISSWLSMPSLLSHTPSLYSFTDDDHDAYGDDQAYHSAAPATPDAEAGDDMRHCHMGPEAPGVEDKMAITGLPASAAFAAADEGDDGIKWPVSASPTYAPSCAANDVIDLAGVGVRHYARHLGELSPASPLPYYAFALSSPSPFARLPGGATIGAGAFGSDMSMPLALEAFAVKGLDGSTTAWNRSAAARQSSRLAGKALGRYMYAPLPPPVTEHHERDELVGF